MGRKLTQVDFLYALFAAVPFRANFFERTSNVPHSPTDVTQAVFFCTTYLSAVVVNRRGVASRSQRTESGDFEKPII